MYSLGRGLQALGLVLLPLALYIGLRGGSAKGIATMELGIMGVGVVLFLLGRKLEAQSRG